MPATIYYEADADLGRLTGRTVAIMGYGSQGHAHALNLRDSGVNVVVGLDGSSSIAKAEAEGLAVLSISEAAAQADVMMMALPDTDQAAVYTEQVAPNLSAGKAIAFSHGFNIHFDQIQPPDDVDVWMIAPKGPGHHVRRTYAEGGGVPALVAIHQDATGNALADALAYAKGIGGTRGGVLSTTFAEETETDLFGEQVVLHQVKLIVDFIYEAGIAGMRYSISTTAEYGDLTRGPRIITDETRAEMRRILAEIQDGSFAKEWIDENRNGLPNYKRLVEEGKQHPIEAVGTELRAMMPWITAGKQNVTEASGGDVN